MLIQRSVAVLPFMTAGVQFGWISNPKTGKVIDIEAILSRECGITILFHKRTNAECLTVSVFFLFPRMPLTKEDYALRKDHGMNQDRIVESVLDLLTDPAGPFASKAEYYNMFSRFFFPIISDKLDEMTAHCYDKPAVVKEHLIACIVECLHRLTSDQPRGKVKASPFAK